MDATKPDTILVRLPSGKHAKFTKTATFVMFLKLAIRIVRKRETYNKFEASVAELRETLKKLKSDHSRAEIEHIARVMRGTGSGGIVPPGIPSINVSGPHAFEIPWKFELDYLVKELEMIMREEKRDLEQSLDGGGFHEWQRAVLRRIKESAENRHIRLNI